MPLSLARLGLLALLAGLLTAEAAAQPITVEIDVSGRDLAGATVGLRGDTAPLAWDRSLPLSDGDGDGVYAAEVAFPEGTGTVAYKAVVERGGVLDWEPGDNRLLLPGRMTADRRAFGEAQDDLPVLTVSAAQLEGDLALLKTAMQTLHPSLGLHNTEAERLARANRLARGARALSARYGEAIPMPEAFLLVTEAVAAIRDGHTQVSLYNQRDYTEAILFRRADRVPFAFRLLDGRMIVTGDATPGRVLPPGTEVLTLDGRAVDDVIDAMMPYTSADGDNDARRRYQLQVGDLAAPAERFDVLYSLLFAPEGDLTLDVRDPDGTERTVAVPRMRAEGRRDVLWARDETLPRSRGDLLRLSFLDDGTALLRIGSFATFNMDLDYGEWLTGAFRAIRERGAERLVVDLRGNAGGMDDAAGLLLAHLIQEPTEVTFWQGVTAYQTVPAALRPHLGSWSDDFYDLSDRVAPAGDGTFRLPDRAPLTLQPAPDAFRGEVAVLVDPGPSSATFYLANTIQQTGTAPLVGQTTGGSLKGLSGGQVAFLTLPHTGIAVDIPLFGSRPPEPGPDRGVVPDVPLAPDADAVIAGRDPELEAAVALLTAAAPEPPAGPAAALFGTWLVDLRPTPDADPYTQPFEVRASPEQPFAGTFYGSPIEGAAVNDDWGDLRIAFTTRDGSGVYHSAAVLRDGRLHGTTHALGRDFLAVWTAVRPLPLQDLVGGWSGTLTDTDAPNASRATLALSAEVRAIPGGVALAVAFTGADGASGGTDTTTLRDGGASFEYGGLPWTEVSREIGDDGFRLVIERDGEDNDRPARIRHTIALEGDVLTDRKEVRYEGTGAFSERNVVRLTR